MSSMSSEIAICDSAHSENVFIAARSSNQKHQFDVIFLESVELVRLHYRGISRSRVNLRRLNLAHNTYRSARDTHNLCRDYSGS